MIYLFVGTFIMMFLGGLSNQPNAIICLLAFAIWAVIPSIEMLFLFLKNFKRINKKGKLCMFTIIGLFIIYFFAVIIPYKYELKTAYMQINSTWVIIYTLMTSYLIVNYPTYKMLKWTTLEYGMDYANITYIFDGIINISLKRNSNVIECDKECDKCNKDCFCKEVNGDCDKCRVLDCDCKDSKFNCDNCKKKDSCEDNINFKDEK